MGVANSVSKLGVGYNTGHGVDGFSWNRCLLGLSS